MGLYCWTYNIYKSTIFDNNSTKEVVNAKLYLSKKLRPDENSDPQE